MDRFGSIGEASKALGVSITTLRRWEREGKLVPAHTSGGHRRYDLATVCPERFRTATDATRKTLAYARVSSHDQKDDLERPKPVLDLYGAHQGWTFEVVVNLGSGMNSHKKGLKRLLAVRDCQTHYDRDINAAMNLPKVAETSGTASPGMR